jgi:hypothetical protein
MGQSALRALVGQATIWGTEQCPDQTDGRAITLQGCTVFIPRGRHPSYPGQLPIDV